MSSEKQKWITAHPLTNYSSMHQLSLKPWWTKPAHVEFNFNLHTPLQDNPQPHVTFHMQDATLPPHPNRCFTISNLTRWRLNISQHPSFDHFVDSLIRWNKCNYVKSQKKFQEYGCSVTYIGEDWTEYAETAHALYANVAKNNKDNKLYDLCFFQKIAKRNDYKLLCAWFEGKMIAMFVLQEEHPTLHSICCGMDYKHSSPSYAYSWLHYELIDLAIKSQKYQSVDIGMTADELKRQIGFQPVPSRMDIHAKNVIVRNVLRCFSAFVTATIRQGQIKCTLRAF